MFNLRLFKKRNLLKFIISIFSQNPHKARVSYSAGDRTYDCSQKFIFLNKNTKMIIIINFKIFIFYIYWSIIFYIIIA